METKYKKYGIAIANMLTHCVLNTVCSMKFDFRTTCISNRFTE